MHRFRFVSVRRVSTVRRNVVAAAVLSVVLRLRFVAAPLSPAALGASLLLPPKIMLLPKLDSLRVPPRWTSFLGLSFFFFLSSQDRAEERRRPESASVRLTRPAKKIGRAHV